MKKIKILIVEDDHSNLNAISGLLKKKGYSVFTVIQVTKKTIADAKKFGADIALLDHDLGYGANGRDVASMIGISKEKLISITSGSFNTNYCMHQWFGKDMLSPYSRHLSKENKKAAGDNLLDLIKKAVG